jgi:uncharacterized phiE125 gp8 family phage protein
MYQLQPECKRIVKPDAGVFSLPQLKEMLRIPLTDATQDFAISLFQKAAIRKIEETTNAILMRSKFRQTMSAALRAVELLTYPVISISAIKTISDETVDTEVLLDPGTYSLAGDYVFARSTWPTHRDYRSFIIEYYAGFGNNATTSEEDIVSAQESIPEDLTLAVSLLTGHFYENREGQDLEGRFESGYIRYGAMPPMVMELIEGYMRRFI